MDNLRLESAGLNKASLPNAELQGQNKYRWEMEFWHQQRSIQAQEIEDAQVEQAKTRMQSAQHNNDVAKPPLEFKAGAQADAKLIVTSQFTTTLISQDASVVGAVRLESQSTSTTNTTNTILHQNRVEPKLLRVPTTTFQASTTSVQTYKNSLIQVKGDSAQVWIRLPEQVNKLDTRSRLVRALEYFGLQLRSFVVNGQSLEPSTKEHRSDVSKKEVV